MSRHRWIILLLSLMNLAPVWHFWPDNEPEYKGKKLRTHVHQLFLFSLRDSAVTEEDKEAEEALARIGAKAIPYLLKWAQYKPSRTEQFLEGLLGGHVDITQTKHQTALGTRYAFRILKPVDEKTLETLLRLHSDKPGLYHVASALEALEVDQKLRDAAAWLGPASKFKLDGLNMIQDLGASGSNAIPLIVPLLKDQDPRVAIRAAETLGGLKVRKEIVLPALERCLQDTRPGVSNAAARAVERLKL